MRLEINRCGDWYDGSERKSFAAIALAKTSHARSARTHKLSTPSTKPLAPSVCNSNRRWVFSHASASEPASLGPSSEVSMTGTSAVTFFAEPSSMQDHCVDSCSSASRSARNCALRASIFAATVCGPSANFTSSSINNCSTRN